MWTCKVCFHQQTQRVMLPNSFSSLYQRSLAGWAELAALVMVFVRVINELVLGEIDLGFLEWGLRFVYYPRDALG